MDDGLLDLVLVQRSGGVDILRANALARSGAHVDLPFVEVSRRRSCCCLRMHMCMHMHMHMHMHVHMHMHMHMHVQCAYAPGTTPAGDPLQELHADAAAAAERP